MEYSSFYKSVLDQDRCAVVLCNLQHEIVYMNEAAAVNYAKWGGKELLGKSLLNCHNVHSNDMIKQVVDWFAVAEDHNIVFARHNPKQNKDVYMLALRENGKLIGYYEKHEFRNLETMQLYDLY